MLLSKIRPSPRISLYLRAFSVSRVVKSAEYNILATAPAHTSYFFLSTPHPPTSSDLFEARYSTSLQKELQLTVGKKFGAKFGFYHAENETQDARLVGYGANGRTDLQNVESQPIETLIKKVENFLTSPPPTSTIGSEIDVYVCTHMARDCRCGERGGEFYRALKQAIQATQDGSRIRIRHSAHVGGHHLAPNVLVYPQGEWLAKLSLVQIPELLAALKRLPKRPLTDQDPPMMPENWRGRMGLTKEEMISLFGRHSLPAEDQA